MVAELLLDKHYRDVESTRTVTSSATVTAPTAAPTVEVTRLPATLLSGPSVRHTPPGLPIPAVGSTGPSPWWPRPRADRTLEVNGNDFDLQPIQASGEQVRGTIDGPLDYNGSFSISANHGGNATVSAALRLALHIQGDSFTNVDVRIAISVRETPTGPMVAVRIENELAAADDPNRVHRRDVPLAVDGATCSFTITVPDPEKPQRSQSVTVRWHNN